MKDQLRCNFTLDDDGISGAFNYLKELSPRKRAQAIRLLLTIGYLFLKGKLKISAAENTTNVMKTQNTTDVDFSSDLFSTLQSLIPEE